MCDWVIWIVWFSDWFNQRFLFDWSIDCLTLFIVFQFSDWFIQRLIDWLIDRLFDFIHCFLIHWLIYSKIDWLIDFIHCLIYWYIDWLKVWLIHWLIQWLIYSLENWKKEWASSHTPRSNIAWECCIQWMAIPSIRDGQSDKKGHINCSSKGSNQHFM